MRSLVKALKAAADDSRFRILRILRLRPLCVCEIADVLGLAQSTVSRHLKILEESDLLTRSKTGLWVEYQLASPVRGGYLKGVLDLLEDRTLKDDERCREDDIKARTVDRHVLCAKE